MARLRPPESRSVEDLRDRMPNLGRRRSGITAFKIKIIKKGKMSPETLRNFHFVVFGAKSESPSRDFEFTRNPKNAVASTF